jgi:molecular chaperone HtpG
VAKQPFKAESQRLLDLMIHSIYTHKEIFLREILSNASDALDKLCYRALTDESVGMSRGDFFIEIQVDQDARTITVSDNGIGMTREEMETNLGTIAHSGSLDFKSGMQKGENAPAQDNENPIDIIGQFGVGFYSAFMVSDSVTVTSRAFGAEDAWVWQSSGADGYTIAPGEKDAQGTDIVMHIKQDVDEEDYSRFLQEYQLVSLVKKYSDYIRYPIRMEREKRRTKEGGEEHEMETYTQVETLNSMVPIWQRPKSQVTDEEYNNFYRDKFMDYQEPLTRMNVDVEGVISYKALLFLPSKASYDYYTKDFEKGLQLYSSGVLIMDKCADLLPDHFRFVRGVVDSPDLSLNISREMLQHDRQLKVIAGNIDKRIRAELTRLMEDEREKYESFYEQFGLQLKYGIVSDFGMKKDDLQDLMLFYSSSEKKLVTLREYRARMPEGQTAIYYATGDSVAFIEALPQAELVRERGYEILCFTHEVDEFVAQTLREYDGVKFASINKDDLGLTSDADKEAAKQQSEEWKPVLDFVKEALGGEITDAVLSTKLVKQPVCLTAGGALSFEMERYLRSVQPDADARADRILELNAEHPVVRRMADLREAEPDKAKDYATVLYQQAKLMAGLPIDNPTAYSELIFSML